MNVAVVGLGKMGSTLARHLLAQGLDVTVWNRHPEAAEALAGAGLQLLTPLDHHLGETGGGRGKVVELDRQIAHVPGQYPLDAGLQQLDLSAVARRRHLQVEMGHVAKRLERGPGVLGCHLPVGEPAGGLADLLQVNEVVGPELGHIDGVAGSHTRGQPYQHRALEPAQPGS